MRDWVALRKSAADWAGDLLKIFGILAAVWTLGSWINRTIDAHTSVMALDTCHRIDPTVTLAKDAKDLEADPLSHPTYFLQVTVQYRQPVSGLRIRLNGLKQTTLWTLKSDGMPQQAIDDYLKALNSRISKTGVGPAPEMLPELPTLTPGNGTALQTLGTSDNQKLCESDWLDVSHPTFTVIRGSEMHMLHTGIQITDEHLFGLLAVGVILLVLWRHRRRKRARTLASL
jgi:hypothetical protein